MPKKTPKAPEKPPARTSAFTPERLRELADFVLREGASGEVRSTLTIGAYLFGQIFHGSEEAFHSKDPTKEDSLRDLAAQDGMEKAGWGREHLRVTIAVSLMAKSHNGFRAWRFLRVSHYAEVLGLPVEKQRALLDQADKGRWSVDRLEEEVGEKKPRKARAETPLAPARLLVQVRQTMAELAARADPSTGLGPAFVQLGLDARAAAELTATLERCVGQLQGFQKLLEELQKRSASERKQTTGKLAAPG
ncbi:MAG TPA: hypothetical protein VGK67_18365 [Myxococcales bacterium]|jgi:hypothetical protein